MNEGTITDAEIVAGSFVLFDLSIPCGWLLLIDSEMTMRATNSMALPAIVVLPAIVIGLACWVGGTVLAAVSAGRQRRHRRIATFALVLHLTAPIVWRGIDNLIWEQPFF